MPTKTQKHRRGGQKQKPSAKSRQRKIAASSQTNQPFEQQSTRRIGQHEGAGKPPMMKK